MKKLRAPFWLGWVVGFIMGIYLGLAFTAKAKEVADLRFVSCIRYLASAYSEFVAGVKVYTDHQEDGYYLQHRAEAVAHFQKAKTYHQAAHAYWVSLEADYGVMLTQEPLP